MIIQNDHNLLHSARIIIDKEEELKKAKGETFKVFSIIRMCTNNEVNFNKI